MDVWYEILVSTSRDGLEELLAATALGGHGRPPCDRDLHLEPLSLSDRVRDLLGGDSHHLVFATAPQTRALLRAAEELPDLQIASARRIEGGRFTFRAEAYSEESAAEIRAAVRQVPPGVAVEGMEEQEERDPEAKGVEMFAPAHEYVYRTQGAVAGAPPGVLEMFRRLEELDFVDVGRLQVAGPEIPLAELAG